MKSIRTEPRNHARRGDERIRTAVCGRTEFLANHSAAGWVYFLRDPLCDGPIKVGFSRDPEQRLAQVNRKLKSPVAIVAAFPGDQEQERELHRRWGRHRLLGEWFRPAPEILAAVELCRVLWSGATARAAS